MKTFTEQAKTIPVRAEVDVVVAGGGPAGVNAAIAAAPADDRLLQLPLDGGKASCTFRASQIAAIVSEPPVVLETPATPASAVTGAARTRRPRFVVVDDFLRTSAPHIFAAGDLNGRMMLVQSAGHEARIAAENALLGATRPSGHQIVPHGGFTDPEYASVGMTEAGARGAHDVAVAEVAYADLDRAVIDGRTEGMCKLIADRTDGALLGAHVVGEQALEIVHMVAAGMVSGMTAEQVAHMEIAYPTYTAVLGLAARRLLVEMGRYMSRAQWRALGPVSYTHLTLATIYSV